MNANPPVVNSPPPPSSRSFGFGHFAGLLLAKAWLILLLCLLSLCGAILYLKYAPKLYESRTVVEVESKTGQAMLTQMQSMLKGELLERRANLTKAQSDRDRAMAELQADEKLVQQGLVSALDYKKAQIAANELAANYDVEKQLYESPPINTVPNEQDLNQDENIKTIEQALLSDTLLLGVIKANGLDKDTVFAPPKKNGVPYSDSQLVERFRTRVKALVRHGTSLIDVSVKDTSPERARLLAGAIVKAFISQNPEAEPNALAQDAEVLKAKLQDAETALGKYRQEHGNNAPAAAPENNPKLKDLNQRLSQVRGQRQTLEAAIAVINRTQNPQDLLSVPEISANAQVASLRDQLSSQPAGSNRQRRLEQALNRAIAEAAKNLTQTYNSAKITEATLTTALAQEQKTFGSDSSGTNPYVALVKEVEIDRARYEAVLARLKVNNIADGMAGNNIRVVASPLLAAKPVEPDPVKTLALAPLLGIIIGCGLIVGIDMADRSIKTLDQAESILGLTALAAIPESKRKSRNKEPVLTTDPTSHEAEAFRSLRTAISFLGPQPDCKTILFTSSNPREGKSYCSLNYAVALAQAGLRTLLIEADVRRPRLSKIALSEPARAGLTDCLTGQAQPLESIKLTGIDNLFLLPAGQRTSRPLELFAACDFGALLDSLKVHFDRIVLDSPPVNAVSDSLLMVKHVQSVCLVVRAVKTPVAAVGRCCTLLTQAGCVPDGFVFNRMPVKNGPHHYFDGYARCYQERGKKKRLKASAVTSKTRRS